MSRRDWFVGASAVLILGGLFVKDCFTDGWPEHDGRIRQTAELTTRALRRGGEGTVLLTALGHFTPKDADDEEVLVLSDIADIALSLVDATGKTTPLPPLTWARTGDAQAAQLTLPDVPDGNYELRATFTTTLGTDQIACALPLFTPARVHVITDRPLYEPGNMVRFRAVVLRARDLAPLDGRPGVWTVRDPNGELVLEEKAPAGDWGVVAGSFPLDRGAATGAWHVAWSSADATDDVAITVQPFKLPRFRVEAAPDKAFYSSGDAPKITGSVVYSSGAPVANATLAVTWEASGEWPPPTAWLDTLLPKTARSGPNGRFELAIPQVPADLLGTARLTAHVAAVDAAGDRVEGTASALLSQDGLAVTAVTELGDGLIQSANNRIYLRVTTPDGGVISGSKIHVRRAWEPHDKGLDAELDADGVASLNFDPGAPVNVVIPPQPYRPAPKQAPVSRGEASELVAREGASLADQVALDTWLPALASCAKWKAEEAEIQVGVRVDAKGAIAAVGAGPSALARCVAGVVRGQHLPAGAERMYALPFTFVDPDLARLDVALEDAAGDAPPELATALTELARGARDCLPPAAAGELARAVSWTGHAGAKEIELGGWIVDPKGEPKAAGALACAQAALPTGKRIGLAEALASDVLGLARLTATPAGQDAASPRPQASTMLGYELLVSADLPAHPSTKLRVAPGTIPNLRLRVTPSVAAAGETVTAELIRGPQFTAKLPKELTLTCLARTAQLPLDAQTHMAMTVLEPGTEGWCAIEGGGARGLVYVRPQGELAVSVAPDRPRYAPGQMAQLHVQTTLGGRGGRAAVGLFGVDQSLGQLVTLPDGGDLARVRPTVATSAPAFGTFDGQALALGRVRGANAAAAVVLRVTSIPEPPALDAVVSSHAESHFDPVAELTDHFYIVLAELHAQTRKWEAAAPVGELMTPTTMAGLWKAALAACKMRGEPVDDAYGRELRLARLPGDLLALTDPRAVVVVGTRLPEDVENWAAYVHAERP